MIRIGREIHFGCEDIPREAVGDLRDPAHLGAGLRAGR